MDGERSKSDSISSSAKPQPTGGGANDFERESSLAGGGAENGGGPALAEKVGGKAGSASESARDIKDVAAAGPTGLESAGKEIKQSKDKAKAEGKSQTKAAAGAAGREAAGAAAGAAATAVTGGAAAPIAGKISKGVSKALKKENRKKVLIGIVAIISVPLIIFGTIIFVIFYAILNPFEFMEKVITDSKVREFGIQAASSLGSAIIGSEEFYKKYGYVENKPGSVIAATPTATPKPGSLEEKLLKIDIKKARYQTGSAPDCPAKYTTKELVSADGKKTNVIDKVYDRRGEEVQKSDFIASYCVIQSMPLYNMMIRSKDAREVNTYSNTVLNYADSTSAPNLKSMSKDDVRQYVYNKTYDRITSKESSTPKTDIKEVDEYIDRVREALANGNNPDNIQFDFGTPNPGIEDTVKTLCTFTKGYLTTDNIQKGIQSRLYSGSRSGVKSNTLASTRKLGFMSNEEMEPTYRQSENWQASIAYSQNVNDSQGGTKIDPERLGNTAYGSGYTAALSLLIELKNQCQDYKNTTSWFGSFFNIFGSLFGGGRKEAENNINAIYNSLREIIVAQSNGKFTTINSFGLEQLMIGVIRMGGGAAVSGLEDGPQNFNNQSQGFRSLSNQYMIRLGGRYLTSEEYTKRSVLSENTRRELEDKNGIAYRLFDKQNIRSLANQMGSSTPKTPNELKSTSRNVIAYISNPLKIIADTHGAFSYYALGKNNKAFAADKSGDAYMRLNSVGLTEEDFKGVNLISNSNEIQDIIEGPQSPQKQIISYFEKCTKSNIPSANLFVRQYKVKIADDEVEVIQNEENVLLENNEGFNSPIYPAVGGNYQAVGFANKKEFIACEIYLNPKGKATQRDYNDAKQTQIFGQPINSLASKYRLYLYANKMADLMVELSSTEKTDSIYAQSSSPSGQNITPNSSGIVGDIGLNSDSVACPVGTNDKGVVVTQYTGVLKKETGPLKIKLCQIPDLPGEGNDVDGSEISGGAIVNSRVAGAWSALAKQAKAEGIPLSVSSSFRLADSCGGGGDGSLCARSGQSMHQIGIAVDFANMDKTGAMGGGCSSGRARLPEDPSWNWLFNNADKFGIAQYYYEAWHWDMSGLESRCKSN